MTKLERYQGVWIYTSNTGLKHYFYSDRELFREAGQSSYRGERIRKHMERYFPCTEEVRNEILKKLDDKKNVWLAYSVLRDA